MWTPRVFVHMVPSETDFSCQTSRAVTLDKKKKKKKKNPPPPKKKTKQKQQQQEQPKKQQTNKQTGAILFGFHVTAVIVGDPVGSKVRGQPKKHFPASGIHATLKT